MRRVALLLLLMIFLFVACHRPQRQLLLSAGGTALAIDLIYPVAVPSGTPESFATICADATALLVSVDVDSSDSIAWDYRFLVSPTGTLYGCSNGGPCADSTIATSLGKPARILVEGIDVP